MRTGVGVVLLLAVAVLAQDKLGGAITGGKAKRLVDKAIPMLKKADKVWNAWILEKIAADQLKGELKRAIRLYDEGTALLQQALDIQEDIGVVGQCQIAARRLQKMRFYVFFSLEKPKKPPPPDQPPPKDQPQPEAPRPAPKPPPPPPRVADEPAPRVAFRANEPPAAPVDVDLPRYGIDLGAEKRDRSAIKARLKEYYQSLRPDKLLFRHRLCGGKGQFSDGATCEECHGAGQRINLHHFRKVFWNSYTPELRGADGAAEALRRFHARAQQDPAALGPAVKSFKLKGIEYHGLWAKAAVELTTAKGKQARAVTLISIGSTWYLYHPETDKALLPTEENG